MSAVALPRLPRTSVLYLGVLAVMAVGFYLLLLASLAAAVGALCLLVIATPQFMIHGGLYSIEVLIGLYTAVCVFGFAILKGLVARVGGDPAGIRANRGEHQRVFLLIDEVATKVGAQPIHDIFITPNDDLGVWEEAALYLPPGCGRRKIVLGMGALSYLTLDQLRAVLAHELGHFSNRDTSLSRYIRQVIVSFMAVVDQLHTTRWWFLNPLYWILALYVSVYALLDASFARTRELYADRFAVEAYGRDLFAQSLAAAHLEGSFFQQVGMPEMLTAVKQRRAYNNLYHYVGVARRQFDGENPGHSRKVLGAILTQRTGAFDHHPSLGERLRAQNVPTALLKVSDLPRVITTAGLNQSIDQAMLAAIQSGPPSAAEELFGGDAPTMQSRLSETLAAKCYLYLDYIRRARAAAING